MHMLNFQQSDIINSLPTNLFQAVSEKDYVVPFGTRILPMQYHFAGEGTDHHVAIRVIEW